MDDLRDAVLHMRRVDPGSVSTSRVTPVGALFRAWTSAVWVCVAGFDEAVEVRHGHNPFGSTTAVPQGHVTATFPLNGGARADEMVPRDMNKAGKLPAMPSSGFIVKVQVWCSTSTDAAAWPLARLLLVPRRLHFRRHQDKLSASAVT